MRTQRNILIAFLLNLSFSVFEFFGGLFTGSVAILSDAVHDLGDALSIGVSWGLEKVSRREPDARYTYGYARFSVLGGVITTLILLLGSVGVILGAVRRLIAPVEVHYGGMIVLAVVGLGMNLAAALVTREGDSLNQKSVNLHMLEDVLGWAVVLVGAVVMRLTDWAFLDPVMSIGVALFILVETVRNLGQILDLFLVRAPRGLDPEELRAHLLAVEGVEDVHHLHVWSMDGTDRYATLHVVTHAPDPAAVKAAVREELAEHGICHAVLETESECCGDTECHPPRTGGKGHHHHHHHH